MYLNMILQIFWISKVLNKQKSMFLTLKYLILNIKKISHNIHDICKYFICICIYIVSVKY